MGVLRELLEKQEFVLQKPLPVLLFLVLFVWHIHIIHETLKDVLVGLEVVLFLQNFISEGCWRLCR